MKYVGVSLIVLWGIGLAVLMFGRGRLRFYVNKRNLGAAAIIGIFGGMAWAIGEPAATWFGQAGRVMWMALVTAFLFAVHGKEHPDKVKKREQKWTIDLPDKTVGRLQLVGLAGALLGSFVVGPAYALFWEGWDERARTLWSFAAVVVGLMMAIPIVILYTRRRRRSSAPD